MGKVLGYVFPGQGSQEVGMGEEFYDEYAAVRRRFLEAEEELGFGIKEIMFKGPREELQKTQNTQPALFLSSMIMLECLERVGLTADICAGHSLGELSAYACAKSLSFRDGLRVVRKRGELMALAGEETKGSMAAIIGLSDKEVEDICKATMGVGGGGFVVPANYNSPGQVVISGERELVKEAMEMAKKNKARMVVELEVSGAFHSPYLKGAGEEFKKYLEGIEFAACKIPVVNYRGEIEEQEGIKDSLGMQLTSAVEWVKVVERMASKGVETIVEIGSGRVLQGLIKKIDKKIKVYSVNGLESYNKLLDALL